MFIVISINIFKKIVFPYVLNIHVFPNRVSSIHH
uniref:Uncharacterized protein n=1 Tax=Arundo donax TaxID=35708 RepID=A0A0A8XV60_ARUDO